MVFTKLSAQEKDAFFALLDEYFRSRPELLGSAGGPGLAGTGVSPAAAASVVQRALAANAGGASSTIAKSNNPYAASMSAVTALAANRNVHGDGANAHTDDRLAGVSSIGRVAAASLAFSGGGGGLHGKSTADPTSSGVAPTLPRRVGNTPASATENVSGPGVEVDKLVSKKASVFNAFKKPPAAGVTLPSAFVAPKNTYGPPPVRRTTSETSSGTTGVTVKAGPTLRAVAPAPPPREEAVVAEGEWAEALYDYESEDPADLTIEAGARVFVTAKSSDDWWTGKVDGQGKEGLFPASYVQLL